MKWLDIVLSTRLAPIIHKSGESLSEDVFLADRDASDRGEILLGRQINHIISQDNEPVRDINLIAIGLNVIRYCYGWHSSMYGIISK